MDMLARFVAEMPAWCGPDGYPLSWRHFVYGMAYLDRKVARWKLGVGDAVSLPHMAEKDRKRWVKRHEIMGE